MAKAAEEITQLFVIVIKIKDYDVTLKETLVSQANIYSEVVINLSRGLMNPKTEEPCIP